jgi:hypothetical protein
MVYFKNYTGTTDEHRWTQIKSKAKDEWTELTGLTRFLK